MNEAALINQIEALLALDERGALAPHGIGGLARDLFKRVLPVLREPVAVKPLEWVDVGEGPRCITVCGTYAIHPSSSAYGRATLTLTGMPGDLFGKFETLEAAQAAAQADYEQRIQQSLVSTPRPDMERELAEARAKVAELENDIRIGHANIETAEAERDALAADKARLAESVHDAESLLSVIAEDAQKAGDIATWSMASVMAEKLRAALSGASIPAPDKLAPTHRHKKRGTEYVLIGIGKMQAEWWNEPSLPLGDPVSVDMREVAIYRSADDGTLWARPREEFEDGRFEEIAAPTPGKAEERREALEEAATHARCAFDDRPRRDSFEWNDGFDDGTKAAAAAIRAIISTPARREGE